jgi:hypothetical protein
LGFTRLLVFATLDYGVVELLPLVELSGQNGRHKLKYCHRETSLKSSFDATTGFIHIQQVNRGVS